MYDKLVAKVNNVDTSKFALKTKYDTYKSNLKKENKWCRKKDYNAKIYEIEDKIPSITGLATTAALTAVENKIPDIINLVKKNKQQIMTQKLNLSILLPLITINLQVKHFMQR